LFCIRTISKLIATIAGGGSGFIRAAPVGSVPAERKRVGLNDTFKKKKKEEMKVRQPPPKEKEKKKLSARKKRERENNRRRGYSRT
jgi:hypothetical protein